MARMTGFGAPPHTSFGRAGSHGRPARSMWSVRGSGPGRRIGIARCVSIEAFRLYYITSTVVLCQSEGQGNGFRGVGCEDAGEGSRPVGLRLDQDGKQSQAEILESDTPHEATDKLATAVGAVIEDATERN